MEMALSTLLVWLTGWIPPSMSRSRVMDQCVAGIFRDLDGTTASTFVVGVFMCPSQILPVSFERGASI